jgi:hypothetical protein
MIVLSALAIALASAISSFEDVERITPEIAAEKAAQCGAGPVTLRYEDDLQEHILTIAGATSATDAQLACIDQSTGWYTVELPQNVQPRFDAIREARASALALEEARRWLSARGLLDRVPKYVEGATDDAAFAAQIEQLCGPRAKGAFQSQYGRHALSPDWMKKMGMPPKSEDLDVFTCLTHVATVAGFKLWFIGNEAYVQQ